MVKKILVISLLLISWSCSNANKLNLSDSVGDNLSENQLSCSSDDQCTVMKADCCGCNMGGTQQAVHKTFLAQASKDLEAKCGETMCTAVISTHESCSMSAVCEGSLCVLR